MEGVKVGSYAITEKLAEGGMGVVYLARHELMGRDAVIKVLLPEMSVKKNMVKRFFNEARAAASIEHPGIVEVFDMGYTDDGRAFIVMERLRGEPLSARLARTRLAPVQAVSVTRQLAGALAAAHERGIVHRDLKPDNLFLVPDPEVAGGERIKVLDFGVAKLAEHKRGSLMTASGAIFGTPAYMAPEQCSDSASVDHRADLYAVGCLLFEMVCGKPPFGHGGIQLLAAHLRDQPPPLRSLDPTLPAALEAIVNRLLEKDPAARFQTCLELVAVLDSLRALPDGVGHPNPNARSATPLSVPVTYDGATPPHAVAAIATAPPQSPFYPPGYKGPTVVAPSQPQPFDPYAAQRSAGIQSVTTHTAAAGEAVTEARERKTGLVAGLAIVVVLAIGGAVVGLMQRGGSDDGEVAEEPAAGDTPVAAATEAAPETPVTTPEPDAAPAPTTAASQTVKIVSSTRGAELLDAHGGALGKLPVEVTAPAGGDVASYTVRAPGHEDESVEVSATSGPELSVALERQRSRSKEDRKPRAETHASATKKPTKKPDKKPAKKPDKKPDKEPTKKPDHGPLETDL